jgi:cell division protein ZapA
MADEATTTAVEIFGGVYHLQGNDDGEYLQELAATVDRKMRDIASYASTADVSRLAILVALNLADELFQTKRQREGERVGIQEKVAALTHELERALASSSKPRRTSAPL